MKADIVICGLIVWHLLGVADAQYPDQFYTNGTQIDVWRREPDRKTILWFARESGERIAYQQSLVVVYDGEPEWAYYINLATRKFVGRYSFSRDGYSLLPEDSQRENLNDITEVAFPPPGEMPTVRQLLSSRHNEGMLLVPPPTKEYPGLETSSWNSTYFTNRHRRIQAKVTFDGDRGSYSFEADGNKFSGTLEDVEYARTEQQLFLITGKWRLEGQEGYFRFAIAPDNLNVFQGEWGLSSGIEGTWSGTRIRAE